MLLYPTYNSTLSVGFAINKHITEQDRREASLTIFQYEVNANGIIPGSEQVHYGSNQITRNGFTSVDNPNITINISHYELSALLLSGSVYLGRFIFLTKQLSPAEIARWEEPFKYAETYTNLHISANTIANLSATGVNTPVWVYNAREMGHQYTHHDFVELVPQVKDVMSRYDISKTRLRRLRNFRAPSKGYIFSNTPLHAPVS